LERPFQALIFLCRSYLINYFSEKSNKLTELPLDFTKVHKENFVQVALDTFKYQYDRVKVYREYCDHLKVSAPRSIEEIPFLPIRFFKSHKVVEYDNQFEKIFKSSGTTGSVRSHHYVSDLRLYERSFTQAFKKLVSDPKGAVIIALLPNYIEQGDSSLIYMVDHLIKDTKDERSGFYLEDIDQFENVFQGLKSSNKTIILIGVSFALLRLAEKGIDLKGTTIIETGGMKGRRKEIIREELHEILKAGLNVDSIFSEYGMTELLSQAYTDGSSFFHSPEWMKVLIRDVNDPLTYLPEGRTGGVNIIDLANIHSCSFIATDDLGVKKDEKFKILGRFDQSDIRGCNLLVN
tara:strand:+ start:120170 stop:121216 length:1047 start_codon:yes stop_codon:yes gene_type:complete